MIWLLVVFVPSHQRGMIRFGVRAVSECGTESAQSGSCCAPKRDATSSQDSPDADDRANCAVCFWAAGLLTTPPFVFDMSHAERAYEHARSYHAQVQRVALRLNHFGRDPPAIAA